MGQLSEAIYQISETAFRKYVSADEFFTINVCDTSLFNVLCRRLQAVIFSNEIVPARLGKDNPIMNSSFRGKAVA